MNSVVRWLESPRGRRWAKGHFSADASGCHDMIELVEDYRDAVIDGGAALSSDEMLRYVTQEEPLWSDLTWAPDLPPERV